jgi:hypothetical protein
MATTKYKADAVDDYFYRPAAAAPHRPTSVKIALLTAITSAWLGTVTEAAYTGYAAQDAAFGTESTVGGNTEQVASSAETYAAVAGGAITIVGYGLKDDLGNWLDITTLGASVTFQNGDIPIVASGAVTHAEG